MEVKWKSAKPERQFRPKHQNQTQQRQDTAHYQEHSTKLLHTVILRQSRLATDYAGLARIRPEFSKIESTDKLLPRAAVVAS